MIQMTDEFVIELRVFMSETKKLFQLHDQSIENVEKDIEDVEKDNSRKLELIQDLVQRMYQIETRLDLKSKGTASQMSYSPEKLKDIVDGLLDRERKKEEELIAMRREIRNAFWGGLAAMVAAIAAGWWLNSFMKPAKAEMPPEKVMIGFYKSKE
jgi:hypothetical protein